MILLKAPWQVRCREYATDLSAGHYLGYRNVEEMEVGSGTALPPKLNRYMTHYELHRGQPQKEAYCVRGVSYVFSMRPLRRVTEGDSALLEPDDAFFYLTLRGFSFSRPEKPPPGGRLLVSTSTSTHLAASSPESLYEPCSRIRRDLHRKLI